MSRAALVAGTQYELIARATGHDALAANGVYNSTPGSTAYVHHGTGPTDAGSFMDLGASSAFTAFVYTASVPLAAVATVAPALPDGENGWYRTAPELSVSCEGDDAAIDCPTPVSVEEGTHPAGAGVVHNAGGDAATYAVDALKVDGTPPSLTPVVEGVQGDNGWYASPVVVSWVCADGTSGVASCSYTSDVQDEVMTVTGSAVDVAGNTVSEDVSVRSDSSPPTITGAVVTPALSDGTYAGPITVHWSCWDSLSGVSACPTDSVVSGLGTDVAASATATDVAGNAAVGTVTGLVRHGQATPAASAPGGAAGGLTISGLPHKYFKGKAVLSHGKTYRLVVTTLGVASSAALAPRFLAPVKADRADRRGRPTRVSGACRPLTGDRYQCFLVASKSMRGSFRTFGVLQPNGAVSYRTVYVK